MPLRIRSVASGPTGKFKPLLSRTALFWCPLTIRYVVPAAGEPRAKKRRMAEISASLTADATVNCIDQWAGVKGDWLAKNRERSAVLAQPIAEGQIVKLPFLGLLPERLDVRDLDADFVVRSELVSLVEALSPSDHKAQRQVYLSGPTGCVCCFISVVMYVCNFSHVAVTDLANPSCATCWPVL